MFRLPTAFLMCVFSSVLLAAPARAHEGNPNYRSEIRALVPAVSGIDFEVLNYDDRLLLTNRTDRRVLVNGYQGEPYIRIQADGTVQVNKRSPSFYLNEDRFAKVEVPADAGERAVTEMGHHLEDRPLRVARPSHPLDVEGEAASGEGRGRAGEDPRLEGAGHGGRPESEPDGHTALGAERFECTGRGIHRSRGGRSRKRPVDRGFAESSPAENGHGSKGRVGMTRVGKVTVLVALALAGSLVWAPGAHAHAILEQTSPARGITVERQPEQVAFRFSEPVEGSFGAVRVFDNRGERVDDGELIRPVGDESVGVKLRTGLPEGTYTATYRVISADAHPIAGGFVFSIGKAGAAGKSVSELTAGSEVGTVTETAFGIARGVTYASIALAIGCLVFLLLSGFRHCAALPDTNRNGCPPRRLLRIGSGC